MLGASISFTLSIIIQTILSYYVAKKLVDIGYSYWRNISAILLCAGIIGLIVELTNDSEILILIGVGVFSFISLSGMLFGFVFNPEERQKINSIIRNKITKANSVR